MISSRLVQRIQYSNERKGFHWRMVRKFADKTVNPAKNLETNYYLVTSAA